MKINILPKIPASCMSISMQCLRVQSYAFSILKKMGTTCTLFAWNFLTMASQTNR